MQIMRNGSHNKQTKKKEDQNGKLKISKRKQREKTA